MSASLKASRAISPSFLFGLVDSRGFHPKHRHRVFIGPIDDADEANHFPRQKTIKQRVHKVVIINSISQSFSASPL